MKTLVFLFVSIFFFIQNACANDTSEVKFHAIQHASFVIEKGNVLIYVDPVGNKEDYSKFPAPNVILITHIHGDHLKPNLVAELKNEKTRILGPQQVIDKLGFGELLKNGSTETIFGIRIETIPAYNTTEERLRYHPKGDGNGYVLSLDKTRVYISGDTEDIPEMRALKNIDHAFVCMNLPYTMTVEQAASAVLEFKPRNVYPYHYRSQGGFSDLEKFKSLVAENPQISVSVLEWYK
jgi:L-ascorbate metabolism protein UlaG (beta-lactamase superfamily)